MSAEAIALCLHFVVVRSGGLELAAALDAPFYTRLILVSSGEAVALGLHLIIVRSGGLELAASLDASFNTRLILVLSGEAVALCLHLIIVRSSGLELDASLDTSFNTGFILVLSAEAIALCLHLVVIRSGSLELDASLDVSFYTRLILVLSGEAVALSLHFVIVGSSTLELAASLDTFFNTRLILVLPAESIVSVTRTLNFVIARSSALQFATFLDTCLNTRLVLILRVECIVSRVTLCLYFIIAGSRGLRICTGNSGDGGELALSIDSLSLSAADSGRETCSSEIAAGLVNSRLLGGLFSGVTLILVIGARFVAVGGVASVLRSLSVLLSVIWSASTYARSDILILRVPVVVTVCYADRSWASWCRLVRMYLKKEKEKQCNQVLLSASFLVVYKMNYGNKIKVIIAYIHDNPHVSIVRLVRSVVGLLLEATSSTLSLHIFIAIIPALTILASSLQKILLLSRPDVQWIVLQNCLRCLASTALSIIITAGLRLLYQRMEPVPDGVKIALLIVADVAGLVIAEVRLEFAADDVDALDCGAVEAGDLEVTKYHPVRSIALGLVDFDDGDSQRIQSAYVSVTTTENARP